ncbi:hypothetical protein C8J35_1214 [Rhizobium sp. PP-F2F-G38]|nr:hypothetical protein C8J35_1214 [Rhizobium sp. PP-F2F-G38]
MTENLRKAIVIFFSTFATWSISGHVASAKLPLTVEIGHYIDETNFKIIGYGVMVRFSTECFVVAPAHVAVDAVSDIFSDPVTARMGKLGQASLSRFDHNKDRDIYVGKVRSDDTLAAFCGDTEDINYLNKEYQLRLQHILARDFNSMQLHMGSGTVNMIPDTPQTLADIQATEPIRYRMGLCNEVDGEVCGLPVQGYSGSSISFAVSPGDRLWLGIHQKRCGEDCSSTEPVWQAISVMQIFAYFTTDYFRGKLRSDPVTVQSNTKPALLAGETLVRRVQSELARLKCEPGQIDGRWGEGSRKALRRFAVAYSQDAAGNGPSVELLVKLEGQTSLNCPAICVAGEVLKDGSCHRVAPAATAAPAEAQSPVAAPSPLKTSVRPLKPRISTPVRTKKASVSAKRECIRVNGHLACPVP